MLTELRNLIIVPGVEYLLNMENFCPNWIISCVRHSGGLKVVQSPVENKITISSDVEKTYDLEIILEHPYQPDEQQPIKLRFKIEVAS